MLRTWARQIPSCACDDSAPPGPDARGHPGECPCGDRVGVALSYLTPDDQWHTIWRTLANPGE
ncbi:hypothetical protein GCM10010384_46270 [Streptomyces djakartensis]|uniref:Uncharacterized protein n=1 Tax=Streptomyces djakartensis TaxID=68193 RepID=A0ABQ3A6C1_9ACTN|nr:hypothetical protein GCM10010384_46270 [Streptomyces djakartensis]